MIPYGVNTGQLDIRLCINMNPSTQAAVLGDVARSLESEGLVWRTSPSDVLQAQALDPLVAEIGADIAKTLPPGATGRPAWAPRRGCWPAACGTRPAAGARTGC